MSSEKYFVLQKKEYYTYSCRLPLPSTSNKDTDGPAVAAATGAAAATEEEFEMKELPPAATSSSLVFKFEEAEDPCI